MCTSITIKSKSGDIFWGRTMDFSTSFFHADDPLGYAPSSIVNIPAQKTISLQSGDIKTSYATMGVGLTGSAVLYDGINEASLTGDLQVLFETERDSDESLKDRGLTSVFGEEVVTYILTQCKNVSEVKKLVATIGLTDEPLQVAGKPMQVPLHYAFVDPSGDSIVIEATDKGAFKVYDNVGVMTNSPEYNYHTVNIRNYISLDNINKNDHKLGEDLEIKNIENGTGYRLFGMPGDYTSPSRFVRSTLVSKNIKPFETSAGITTLYNVFKPVMIPAGLSLSPENKAVIDYTQYWAGFDLSARKIYVQDHACPTMTSKTIDLKSDEITYTPVSLDFTPVEA